MSKRGHSGAGPPGTSEPAERATTGMAREARTLRGVVALCLGSLAVMVPWPLLAILATHPYLDNRNEVVLLFGGITGIPVVMLMLVGVSETAAMSLISLAWIAAAVVPDIWLARRLSSRQSVLLLLGAQAAFSFAQAAVGAMMIFGKAV